MIVYENTVWGTLNGFLLSPMSWYLLTRSFREMNRNPEVWRKE